MMTLTYPENYALLTMEEMMYTTGGDAEGENKGSWVRTAFNIGMAALATVGIVKTVGSAISSGSITGLMATVCGLGTTVLGYLNISSIGAIAGQIQPALPAQAGIVVQLQLHGLAGCTGGLGGVQAPALTAQLRVAQFADGQLQAAA